MKKLLSVLVVLALAVSCTSHKPFRFVQMTDPQIGFIDNTPLYHKTDSLLQAAVTAANAMEPAAVIITGDLVNNPADSLQCAIYQNDIGQLLAPVYEIPGNHDPESGGRFFFQKEGCSFIGLDSNCIKDGVQEEEAEQKEWLVTRLKEARRSRFIFVFLHCPIIRESMDEAEDYFNFSMAQRQEYLNLFKEYGVSAVFAGHTHMDYYAEWEGIRLYTAGPVGSPLGRGKSGFLVVDVDKDSFTVSEHLLLKAE